jgi:hypothetical protein
MYQDSFRLDEDAQLLQTIQKVFPGLFSVWTILHVEKLDSFHRPIIVEKNGLFGNQTVKIKIPRVSL